MPEAQGQERLELLWVAGKACNHLAMWREASGYLTEAVSRAEGEFHQRAVVALAHSLIEYGEPAEAEGRLLTLLADETLTPLTRAQALHNLAMSYERRRQYGAAVDVYTQAVDSYLNAGRRREALTSLQNAAFLALVEGVTQGEELLRRAAALLEHGGTAHQTAQIALEAFHALLCGRNHEAIQGAEELLQPDHMHASDWDRALAGYVAARVASAEGQVMVAKALATKARSWGTASRDIRLMSLMQSLNDLREEV